MYEPSDEHELTADQLRELDNTFFRSSPDSYWRSRIDGLLRGTADPGGAADLTEKLHELGVSDELLSVARPSPDDVEFQRGLDAFMLRHHLAESLVRLVHAVLVQGDRDQPGVWAALTSSPTRLIDVVTFLRGFEEQEAIPADLFIPPEVLASMPAEEATLAVEAVAMHWRWIRRSMALVAGDGLDLNAGNNKIKHGLSVRAHNMLRVAFVADEPSSDGTVKLSSVQAGLQIIDERSVEFLQRLPAAGEHGKSWEITVLNLRPADLIAESVVLSSVWSSVFASAAARHLPESDDERPTHHGLVLGPHPSVFAGKSDGYRQALTRSPKSGGSRGLVVAIAGRLVPISQTGPKIEASIVDG